MWGYISGKLIIFIFCFLYLWNNIVKLFYGVLYITIISWTCRLLSLQVFHNLFIFIYFFQCIRYVASSLISFIISFLLLNDFICCLIDNITLIPSIPGLFQALGEFIVIRIFEFLKRFLILFCWITTIFILLVNKIFC